MADLVKPLNAQISEALGWRVWQDPRPGKENQWLQVRDHPMEEGLVQVAAVPDYLKFLKSMVVTRTRC